MRKTIALAIGMTGLFYPSNRPEGAPGVRASITHVWSENLVNVSAFGRVSISVRVPSFSVPLIGICPGDYFIPDAFLAAQPPISVEQAIAQAGADKAPRVTPAEVEANIVNEFFFSAEDGVVGSHRGEVVHSEQPHSLSILTFCVLVLRNGFTVTGESACASPENFNAEIGRRIARENAVAKIWPLMGYALKEQLSFGTWIQGTVEHVAAVDPRAAAVAESYGYVTHGG